jgi:hypothetical protein
VTYVGARSRLSPAKLSQLTRSWVVQPKLDGAYCTAVLDSEGCIVDLVSRRRRSFAASILDEFLGCRIGAPNSILVGELEAHTEAANRQAAVRGFRCLYLFDALVLDGHQLNQLPYRLRRDALLRDRAQLELAAGDDRPWQTDVRGNFHSLNNGRFTQRCPRSWRRAPIIPQMSGHRAQQAWSEWVERDGGEGLVAVALQAPAGSRGSKRKVKATSSIDCTVVEVGKRSATVHWLAAGTFFSVGTSPAAGLTPGSIVEVSHDGFYERTGIPRFPRLVRRRHDLEPSQCLPSPSS